MRFNATLLLNVLSAKAYTRIDTIAYLNFVSKEFVIANSFYTDCKTDPNQLAIRVPGEQPISTTKVFCPSVNAIDGHEFTALQFRVLPRFKSSDIILGLPTLKQLGMIIHHSLNAFTMGNFTISCNRESHRISCVILDSDEWTK